MGELETLRVELEQTKQVLKKTERQLEKSQSYNEELRQQLETLSTELHKYRSAAQNKQDATCQVQEKDIAEAYGDKPFPEWGTAESSSAAKDVDAQNSGTSIAESLKAAAQEVVWEQAGFVFDSHSGLYYDYNSGYYYDSAQSLYYDPRTGSYFYYDENAREYKFHSYASGQQPQETQPSEQEDGNKVSGAPSTERETSSSLKSLSRRKIPKKKEREKPKAQKPKRSKMRRRTKESRHREKKKKESLKGQEIVMIGDSDEDENIVKDKRETEKLLGKKSTVKDIEDTEVKNRGATVPKLEVIEVESSDSLGTGESELESEPESGELDSSSSHESECQTDDEAASEPMQTEEEEAVTEPDVSANWPPCVRVMVLKSDVADEGTLFLVTCTGGTVGREKDPKHVVQIPDINISKVHAEIQFDYSNNCYTIQDLGSQNGTFINDLRISETKVQSAAVPVCHGDTLQVGGTRMLLHIHPGTDTCDQCEPGQVLAAIRAQQTVFNDHVVLTKEEKKQQARKQLKQIKKKYGLANAAYVDNPSAVTNAAYADKADLRRKFVGSEHPSHKPRDQAPASVHRPISAENKGHRMLAKMGWKEGSGLGKDSAGRAEPVNVEMRANQSAGLGSTSAVSLSLDDVQSAHKAQRWAQAQLRYHNADRGAALSGAGFAESQSAGGRQAGNAGEDSRTGETNGSGVRDSGTSGGGKVQFKWIKGGTQKPP